MAPTEWGGDRQEIVLHRWHGNAYSTRCRRLLASILGSGTSRRITVGNGTYRRITAGNGTYRIITVGSGTYRRIIVWSGTSRRITA